MSRVFQLALLSLLIIGCKNEVKTELASTEKYDGMVASHTVKPIVIDGLVDKQWDDAKWHPIDQVWLGGSVNPQDFKGEYKLKYDENYLYVLANITDDKLYEQHEDGLYKYWDDDCLEIFVDEDRSKGLHQFTHNAFAYHIALDGKVADYGTDSLPHYYDDHVASARKSSGMRHLWEVAIKIYDDSYQDGGDNTPAKLTNGHTMGFAIAYCDNDGSKEREHFIGSTFIPGDNKNIGYKDAGIFDELKLK